MLSGMRRPNRTRDRSVARLLVVAAFLLPCLMFCVAGPGLPYQDPTPEMSAQYAADESRSDMLTAVAAAIGVALLISAIWLFRRARRTEPGRSDEPDTEPDADQPDVGTGATT
jgi:hypothetical protein